MNRKWISILLLVLCIEQSALASDFKWMNIGQRTYCVSREAGYGLRYFTRAENSANSHDLFLAVRELSSGREAIYKNHHLRNLDRDLFPWNPSLLVVSEG